MNPDGLPSTSAQAQQERQKTVEWHSKAFNLCSRSMSLLRMTLEELLQLQLRLCLQMAHLQGAKAKGQRDVLTEACRRCMQNITSMNEQTAANNLPDYCRQLVDIHVRHGVTKYTYGIGRLAQLYSDLHEKRHAAYLGVYGSSSGQPGQMANNTVVRTYTDEVMPKIFC
jgi:hypothetical protein